ncbi:c-type cytochrome [Trichlorobacter ammonificans]|uniref:Cytochrome c n=1 Tax=Trichlorobacter ammonificans TaxID=2916410 RepID=A0ABM9D8J7_9BACT|nr:hypothetical protein [Trichlorobacter ammonificans]CAH2031492.1 Cytochrome c [Trichlorobacter ammonificans]
MRHLIRLGCLLILALAVPAGTTSAQQEPAPVPAGDPARGADLYTGALSFAKGAAPCGACHALANRGITGARMAADLGGLFTADSADAIRDTVGAIEVPVMKKIYSAHPLTDTEYADLAAFARQPLPTTPVDRGTTLPLAGAGVAALFLLCFTFHKRRIS